MSGIFITIEGPDGAGKTSVINELYPRLQMLAKKGIIKTREPGGSKIAEKIRQIILDPRHGEMDERTEALLYAAARRQHLVEVILPALNAGKIVICDRFVDSSLAYQGIARGIGFDEVLSINEFAIEGHFPDMTLYLEVDAQKGLSRIERRVFLDRLDQEALSFHEKVVEGYQMVMDYFKHRVVRIDAGQDVLKVQEDALEVVLKKVKEYV